MTVKTLFDLEKSRAGARLSAYRYPWEALADLPAIVRAAGEALPAADFDRPAPDVWIAKNATVSPLATLCGPLVIDEGCEVRAGALFRGGVLLGRFCVVGNSTEIKNAILFDKVQVPHYNYVGDSILGYAVHLGAGSILSNLKGDRSPVTVTDGNTRLDTGRKKVGAFLGDFVEVGCHAVLNPGTVVGKRTRIYPLSSVRGTLPADVIYKNDKTLIPQK